MGGPTSVINSSLAGVYKTAKDLGAPKVYGMRHGIQGFLEKNIVDLDVTDHTPGFGSAAKYIASVSKELIRDGLVYDQKQITIIEIMGRNAGWLTAAAGLARCEDCEGVDLIYLPELPFDIDKFLKKVERLFLTKKALVVAVSEGIKTEDGTYVSKELIEYIRPLIQAELSPIMITGQPRHIVVDIDRI